MATWQSEYLEQIDDCEKRESRLTEWEVTFLDSLKSQLEEGKRPTPKQIDALDAIWEKVTSKG